mmetsp:Transcript_39221/g.78533  ORF Transcript_39221/g.78533 Transcript_39221/m.78533 type:complete len:248 (+) Transcript_39221:2-745(+)
MMFVRTVALLVMTLQVEAFSGSALSTMFSPMKGHAHSTVLASPRSHAFSSLRMQEQTSLLRRQIWQGAATLASAFVLGPLHPVHAFFKEDGKFPLMGDESIMAPKAHGTTANPVQSKLRWGCDVKLADNICSFNRDFAEFAGYFETTAFLKEMPQDQEVTFYDSVTGKPLFIAPRGRSYKQFIAESKIHGWPSFRDEEVVWDNVRCLRDGETVSTDGTHLGHNLPDRKGNRYCINLVSIAGLPPNQA